MKDIYLISILLIFTLAIPAYTPVLAESNSKLKPVDFRNDMRKLWEDHITWTRMFIVSDAANLPDTSFAAQRLLQNQTDIGNAVKPFYGDQAGDQLTALLHDHILIAAELVDDAKSGNTVGFNDAKARWYDNANQIAAFLHAANPDQWPFKDMQEMMKSHLDLTLAEATARLNGNWTVDIQAYHAVHNEILQMADMLSLGIIHQFPEKFRQ